MTLGETHWPGEAGPVREEAETRGHLLSHSEIILKANIAALWLMGEVLLIQGSQGHLNTDVFSQNRRATGILDPY